MDDATADRLVTLRSLFESARARAQDPTPAGRHATLVLLDGACELALRHAADRVGVPRERLGGLETVYEGVRSRISPAGTIAGWVGVRQMHNARNSAQHAGVLPDPAQLSRWVGDCDEFLHNLVDAAFGVRLSDLYRADALSTPALRELFAEAEGNIGAGDAPRALAKALDAFDVARSRWREQRAANGLGPRPMVAGIFSDTNALETALGELGELLEVQAFAPDMAEYLWLTSLAARPGPPASLVEAQRALVFTFEWVLRWEAFSARYGEDVVQQWRHDLRPPRTEHPELGPRLAGSPSLQVSGSALPGSRPFVNVELQMVDAPQDGFEPWLAELQVAVVEGWKAMSEVTTYAYPTVDRTGRVTLPSERPEIDAEAVTGVIRRAIAVANQRAAAGTSEEAISAHRDSVMALVDEDKRPMFLAVRCAFVDATDKITLHPVIELVPQPKIAALVQTPQFAQQVQTFTRSFVRVGGQAPIIRVDRSVDPAQLGAALKEALRSCRDDAADRAEDQRLKKVIESEVSGRFLDAIERQPEH